MPLRGMLNLRRDLGEAGMWGVCTGAWPIAECGAILPALKGHVPAPVRAGTNAASPAACHGNGGRPTPRLTPRPR